MKQNDIKISVIIPLYNAGKYLQETLDSVLGQTFTEFELICVNDASQDNTMEILKRYQEKDNRIIILENKERQGAGPSRNRGMAVAKGKYLVFLDGDDIFDEEMLQLEYECAETYDADVVVCEQVHAPSDEIYQKKSVKKDNAFYEKYGNRTFEIMGEEITLRLRLGSGPCNKMFRREYIQLQKLEFQNLSCCNDVYFVCAALLMASKIRILNENRVMVYLRDHYETSRISFHRDPMCSYWSMKKLGEELSQRKILKKLNEYYYYEMFCNLLYPIGRNSNEAEIRKYYNFLQQEGIDNLIEIDRECYQSTPSYLKKAIEHFKTDSYESKWYTNFSMFAMRLEMESVKNTLFNIIQKCKDKDERVFLWGAGKNGKLLVDFLEKYNISISGVLDCDERKAGTSFGKYIVESPDNVLCESDMILFTSNKIYDEMKVVLRDKYKVFNI